MGGSKVILATVPSGRAMSAVLGGLAINGKLIVIGAGDDNIEVSPLLLISGRDHYGLAWWHLYRFSRYPFL
jgi:D-arabinose 1-dehydrogenase-like Zn-dependent alcohol dehydrogenase